MNDNLNFLKPELDFDGKDLFARSYLQYGHIRRGDNHYQYYFDFEKLTEDKQRYIDEWAEKIRVQDNAYNIVISPLQITNASFLKIVLDNSFGSNLHLLHININDTGKESVRTRFSYIAEELKKIHSAYSDVNFYYVDDSVCTGAGVARAYKFLITLCSQAQIDLKKWFGGAAFKFKKVFLLVNRCSYETALTWVKNPVTDWHGFINLCVPSYNTHSNTCPGCRINERYELLRKRSATNGLTSYFDGQAKKHIARTPQEYDLWLRSEMTTNPTYFSWLRLWLRHADNKPGNIIKSGVRLKALEEKIKDLKVRISGYYNHIVQSENDEDKWTKQSLKSFFKWMADDKKNREDKEKIAQTKNFCIELLCYIKSEDNFVRLKTMNKAYKTLIYGKIPPADGLQERIAKVKEQIWVMLNSCAEAENIYDSVMKFISYIKVISRDYLAKNYYIKAAMQCVMVELFDRMTDVRNDSMNKFLNIDTVLIYRIIKNIIHRLALSRSDYIVKGFNIVRIVLACELMKKKYKEKNLSDQDVKIFAALPTAADMASDYVATIKTATMEENNDGMCFKLSHSLNILNTAYPFISEDNRNILAAIKSTLLIENNRMLYDFMEILSNKHSNLSERITLGWEYEGYIGQGGLKKRYDDIGKLSENLYTEVGQSDNGGLYQNPLSAYIRFYNKAFAAEKEKTETSYIAEMLNAFNICRFLTEPAFKEKRHKAYESLPYIFEDLCLSVKNMTDGLSCYFVYKKDGEISQLVSRSGYAVGENNYENYIPMEQSEDKFSALHIGASEFDLIIDCFKNKKEDGENICFSFGKGEISVKTINEIVSGVKVIRSSQTSETRSGENSQNQVHFFYVFDIPVKNDGKADNPQNSEEPDERHFYILIENKNDIDEIKEEQLCVALRVLFLRNRVWELLHKYYSGLLNFRFYVDYIRHVGQTDVNAAKSKVMHISDLHLADDESWRKDGWKWTTLNERLSDLNGKVELLTVTGDVIDYPNDANDAQRKYKRVANLLFDIAKVLWGLRIDGRTILPHDWKRRILITTGNHDYAAMNDVRVQTKSRKIESGLPASSSGGTMSRYTYFIEFLSYFLDAPTKRLLEKDLNEVRYYKKLGLIVGIFNSCSENNALQNNKVSINKDKLQFVLTDSVWYKKPDAALSLALIHHSPYYHIDYFEDKYTAWNWYKIDGVEKLFRAFCSALITTVEGKNENTGSFTGLFEDFVEDNSFNEDREFRDFCKSQLYSDMQMLYGVIKKNFKQPEEYYKAFLSSSSDLAEIQSTDNVNLKNCRDLILKGVKKVYFLAGHEHMCAYYDEVSPTFVIDRLYKNNSMWFEIFQIDKAIVSRDINVFKDLMWWNEATCTSLFYKKI